MNRQRLGELVAILSLVYVFALVAYHAGILLTLMRAGGDL